MSDNQGKPVELTIRVPIGEVQVDDQSLQKQQASEARQLLLDKLRNARKDISMAAGQSLTAEEYSLLGYDMRGELDSQAKECLVKIDLIIDSLEGDSPNASKGWILYSSYWPFINMVLGLIGKLF